MTDNQDSKIKVGVQTPPTDRPLTAGDVWIEWHGGENPVPGQMVNIRHRGLRDMDDSEWAADLQCWRHSFDNREASASDIIAYRLARPATASEGDNEVSAEAVGWIRSASKEVVGGNCAFVYDDLRVLTHLAKRAVDAGLTDQLSESVRQSLAALASPPVSERERELEGALGLIADGWGVIESSGSMGEMTLQAPDDWEGDQTEIVVKFHGLTAQPAGEGK